MSLWSFSLLPASIYDRLVLCTTKIILPSPGCFLQMPSSWCNKGNGGEKIIMSRRKLWSTFRVVSKIQFFNKPNLSSVQDTLNLTLFSPGTSWFSGCKTIWTPLVDFVLKLKACSGLLFLFSKGEGLTVFMQISPLLLKDSGGLIYET